MEELHAVIGVWYRDGKTYYVKRSSQMENYPNVWSLLSIQFDPNSDSKIQELFELMSEERLNGAKLKVKEHLTSGDDPDSPVGQHVHLHLYELELLEEPKLNSKFYTDARWMTPAEYQDASVGQKCGLCLRLWSDYAWLAGLSDRPFVPMEKEE